MRFYSFTIGSGCNIVAQDNLGSAIEILDFRLRQAEVLHFFEYAGDTFVELLDDIECIEDIADDGVACESCLPDVFYCYMGTALLNEERATYVRDVELKPTDRVRLVLIVLDGL